jgi:geranylgeranyl diphosphate synthase, type I
MTSLSTFFDLTIPVLESEMRRIITQSLDPKSDLLREIFLYHLGMDQGKEVRGKRVRPMLVFIICHACQGEWQKAVPAAAAVEFLHNFSLIHDDIEDRSDKRHGRPTVWAKWGAAQAINSGDGMFTLVFQAIQQMLHQETNEKTLEAIHLITQTCLKLVEGQILDVAFETQEDIAVSDYYRMIDGKTATLLACCAQLGGLVAGIDTQKMGLLNKLGSKLGRSFQIQDDILGIWGDSQETGKPVTNDLIEHKHSLPIIYGLQMSPRFKKRWMQKEISLEDTPTMVRQLTEDGVHQKVEKELAHLDHETDKIIKELNFPNKEGSVMLGELMAKLRIRKR